MNNILECKMLSMYHPKEIAQSKPMKQVFPQQAMYLRRLKPNALVCFDCKSVCHPSLLEKTAAERLERGSLLKDQPEALTTPSPFLHMDCTVLQARRDLPRRNGGAELSCGRLYNLICLFTVYDINTAVFGLLERGGAEQKEESLQIIVAPS